MTRVCVECIICGEYVLLTGFEEWASESRPVYKVCDKCKQAVMKMRGDK